MIRIAVVDDNESWCFVLANALHQHGFTVETFTNPHTFLAQAGNFDVALIDYSIPAPRYQAQLEGPDILSHIKAHAAHPPLMILLSSYFMEDMLGTIEALYTDADACLSKSLSVVELIQQIQQLIYQSDRPSKSANKRIKQESSSSFKSTSSDKYRSPSTASQSSASRTEFSSRFSRRSPSLDERL